MDPNQQPNSSLLQQEVPNTLSLRGTKQSLLLPILLSSLITAVIVGGVVYSIINNNKKALETRLIELERKQVAYNTPTQEVTKPAIQNIVQQALNTTPELTNQPWTKKQKSYRRHANISSLMNAIVLCYSTNNHIFTEGCESINQVTGIKKPIGNSSGSIDLCGLVKNSYIATMPRVKDDEITSEYEIERCTDNKLYDTGFFIEKNGNKLSISTPSPEGGPDIIVTNELK
jgi:hypothetical protein